ncbi:hypothetical protein WA026_005794 [Henosepilachna vigintioctopunctata]|uniref:Secreted protein n=1 Tax=Henosepilachna vigintioctopunctata TaxID=420089 RepID=A0AAW1U1Z1_9CUCU
MLSVSAWWSRVCAIASAQASKSYEFVARVRDDGHDEAAGDPATQPPWTTRSTKFNAGTTAPLLITTTTCKHTSLNYISMLL